MQESAAGGRVLHPLRPHHRGDQELVEEPAEDPLHRDIQVIQELRSCALALPVDGESSIAINWPGRDCREEKEESEELTRRERRDHPIPNAEDDIEGTEGDVRDPRVTECRLRREVRQELRHDQRQDRKRHGRVEDAAAFPSQLG